MMTGARSRPDRRRWSATRRRVVLFAAATVAALAAGAVLTACTGSGSRGDGPGGDALPDAQGTGVVTGTGTDLIPPDSGSDSVPGPPVTPTTAATTPPGPPAAAVLPWLGGDRVDDGITLGRSGARLWQGPRAGERAVLGDGWYRYFGPDGSAVGCTSSGACVGVGADGTVAITRSRGGVRQIYRGDGTYVGGYDADGTKVQPEAASPPLADALAATGVDVADLVNAATLTAPFAGGATGDPHLVTGGGQRFASQLIGQFVARGGDPTHRVQLRFEPMAHREDVSIVSAVAIGTGANVVIVDASGVVTVDGRPQASPDRVRQVSMGGGVVLGRWPQDAAGTSAVAVLWPDGSSVVVSANAALGLTVVADIFPRAGATGLFGTDGSPAGADLLARGGGAASVSAAVESWRVTPSERLLPAPSEPPAPFPTRAATVDPGAAKVAQQICASSALSDRADLAACAFDVGLTGDTGFVAGHLALGAAATSRGVAPLFGARWPALLAPPPATIDDLPTGGQLGVSLASGQVRAFRVALADPGTLRIIYRSGCAADANPPGIDQPAMRVFDAAGHAVSDRVALCGHVETPELARGDYLVEVANGLGRPPVEVHGSVEAP